MNPCPHSGHRNATRGRVLCTADQVRPQPTSDKLALMQPASVWIAAKALSSLPSNLAAHSRAAVGGHADLAHADLHR